MAACGESPESADPSGNAGSDDGAATLDYEEYLVDLADAIGITEPPATELVRLVSQEEQASVWQECMGDAGYEVNVTWDGGMVGPAGLPEDQEEIYREADYVCLASYPVNPAEYTPWGESQVAVLYEYYANTLAPCLEERGFSVDGAPTFATFLSSWVRDREGWYAGEGSWFPYDSVDQSGMSDEQWQELNGLCPQAPTADVLFPDG